MTKADRELLKQYAARFILRRGNVAYWQVSGAAIAGTGTRAVKVHAMANAVSAIKQAIKDEAAGKPSEVINV